jgi:hypothetical protein
MNDKSLAVILNELNESADKELRDRLLSISLLADDIGIDVAAAEPPSSGLSYTIPKGTNIFGYIHDVRHALFWALRDHYRQKHVRDWFIKLDRINNTPK